MTEENETPPVKGSDDLETALEESQQNVPVGEDESVEASGEAIITQEEAAQLQTLHEPTGIPQHETEMKQTPSQIEANILEKLKAQAASLGIKHHPMIKGPALQEKINAVIEMEEAAAARIEKQQANAVKAKADYDKQVQEAGEDEAALKAIPKPYTPETDPMALVRVIISCMDTDKAEYASDIFTVGNSVIPTVRRAVRFNTPWHVERIILNMIKERKMKKLVKKPGAPEGTVPDAIDVPAFAIQELTPLTKEELANLKNRQLMQQGQETPPMISA